MKKANRNLSAPPIQVPISEVTFADLVIEMAQWANWHVAHFRPARTVKGWRTAMQGDPGFPDLVLAKDGHVVFVELKSEDGHLTDEQIAWGRAIDGERIAPPWRWQIWRPYMMGHIRELLGVPETTTPRP